MYIRLLVHTGFQSLTDKEKEVYKRSAMRDHAADKLAEERKKMR